MGSSRRASTWLHGKRRLSGNKYPDVYLDYTLHDNGDQGHGRERVLLPVSTVQHQWLVLRLDFPSPIMFRRTMMFIKVISALGT